MLVPSLPSSRSPHTIEVPETHKALEVLPSGAHSSDHAQTDRRNASYLGLLAKRHSAQFDGELYRLTLMTPFFSPKPMVYPQPPVSIAGVNPLMCRLAGELCEGLHVHPLHSMQYLQEHVLPNIMQGAAKTGRSRHDIALVSAVQAC